MHVKKLQTSLVITLAIISLLGLGWVQYNWLKDSIATNKQIFQQKTGLASGVISKSIRDSYYLQTLVFNSLANQSSNTEKDLEVAIDSILRYTCGLNAPFQIGIYTHSKGSEWFVKKAGSQAPSDLNLKGCSGDRKENLAWITVNMRNDIQATVDHAHLGIFFTPDNMYLISQMKETVVAAVIFIFLLSGCFSYTVWTIRKQKRLSEMKNDFINNLTHEFKTPIFSIDLAAGILKNAPEVASSDRLESYASIIKTENERLKNQVDKVLQMALVDSDNFRLEKKNIDLHELVHKVVNSFAMLIKERSGEIVLNLEAERTQLFGDETHLKNIIYNLLDNAQKYSPDRPKITISTKDSEEGIVLQIEDNGIGMSEQVQKFVFDKFYRADSGDVHNTKGFGLGLSYVKSVIDAHQGKIKLISRPNEGSKFTLQFKS